MSEKIAALIEEVKGLTVVELAELVHALEDTFGVSAAAAAVAAPAAAGEAAEEKTEFDVVPKTLKEAVSKDDAEKMINDLKEAGATAEMK